MSNGHQERYVFLGFVLELLHDFAIAKFFATNNRKKRMFEKF